MTEHGFKVGQKVVERCDFGWTQHQFGKIIKATKHQVTVQMYKSKKDPNVGYANGADSESYLSCDFDELLAEVKKYRWLRKRNVMGQAQSGGSLCTLKPFEEDMWFKNVTYG